MRFLNKNGHSLEITASAQALKFVTPATLETFNGKKLLPTNPFDVEPVGTDHIKWARWADAVLVYGATAQTLSKLATAAADEFLHLQILATRAPVFLAPAMNPEMWNHPLVQKNVKTLKSAGYHFVGPVPGTVACGETGVGHIADLSEISNFIENFTELKALPPVELEQKKFLVSVGPMRSPLDPARFLANRSSGLMGLELCRALRHSGADVTVALGPVDSSIRSQFDSFRTVSYVNSQDYKTILDELFPLCDVFVSAAAVLDFEYIESSSKYSRKSISQSQAAFPIRPVEDFVVRCSQVRKPHQKLYAFSAEQGNASDALVRAHSKMLEKKCDGIFMNLISDNTGFESHNNQIWALSPQSAAQDWGFHTKTFLAHKMVHYFFNDLNRDKISSRAVL